MKIGILSMQRVQNYGSFLQSYALKKILEEMGHEVTFVDIECANNRKTSQHICKLKKILKKVNKLDKYLFKRIKYSKKNAQLDKVFIKVQKKYFNLTDKVCTAENCDAVVIGSDEIFNCDTNSVWGVTSQRFGYIEKVPVVFSYAASCGYTQIQDVSESDSKLIIDGLNRLKGISVRDQNTAFFVKSFIKSNIEINLDPVLVYDFYDELNIGFLEGTPREDYMVIYAYHNRIENQEEINTIRRYAKKHNLKTIAIGGSLPWCDEFAVLSPFQVLSYFVRAKCIVTDTFHGTVIASKYNKPLAVLVRGSNANKLVDLLNRIGIEEHWVKNIHDLDRILDGSNDYRSCNEIIQHEQEHALDYLKRIINSYSK